METLQWTLGFILETLEVSGSSLMGPVNCSFTGSDNKNSLSYSVNLE